MHRLFAVNLNNQDVEKNKEFLRTLFALNEAVTWFDKLDCKVSVQRLPDPEMTLDSFLEKMTADAHCVFQAWKEEATYRDSHVQYGVNLEHDSATRFAWVEFPYNSLDTVVDIFRSIYNAEPIDLDPIRPF